MNIYNSPSKSVPSSAIRGTTTNDSAAAGSIGEYIESVVPAAGVALTSGAVADITSISLTPGDWDVTGVIGLRYGAGTTCSAERGSISQVAGTLGTVASGQQAQQAAMTGTTVDNVFPVGPVRISLSATTTLYLNAMAVFAVNTMNAWGTIRARRAR